MRSVTGRPDHYNPTARTSERRKTPESAFRCLNISPQLVFFGRLGFLSYQIRDWLEPYDDNWKAAYQCLPEI